MANQDYAGTPQDHNIASSAESPADPPYSGYAKAGCYGQRENALLTHVGPGTPCGEYMRRFWHPIALSSEVRDGPIKVRVLGEDLIVFQDQSGNIGLLHERCCHRGVSLQYGICESRGLRCCYHGWLFDADGTILEIPGEPSESKGVLNKLKNLRQGAYPTHEYKGLIFAYLGPPENRPEFPIFDTFDLDGHEMQPYARHYPCNWLQITENAMDPVHAVFLHVRATGPQFAETWGQLSVKKFHRRETGLYYTNARRVDDMIWVRLHEIILPNLTHAGAVMTMDGRTQKYFGRNTFTRWVVPVDDVNSRVIAWANFGNRTDPPREQWRTDVGIDIIEGGMPRNRSPKQSRDFPGDYEAFVGQGSIAVHDIENLSGSDRGVAMFRLAVRQGIKAVQRGEMPVHPNQLNPIAMPTYCGDTVLRIPRNGLDEEEELLAHSRKVIEIIRSGDHLTGQERDRVVIERLKAYEASQ